MNKHIIQLGLFILLATAVACFFIFDFQHYLSLDSLKLNLNQLIQFRQENPIISMGIFLAIYVFSTALSLPGATVLTLAGGALFGLVTGFILVSFASTIGATCAFLASRYLLHDAIQSKFKEKLARINQGVEKEGAFFLFTLRLVPVFPFFLVNLVMGLTPIKTLTFFFVSQLGMIPGTFAYVNAGTALAQIESLKGILSFNLILSFIVIGLLPLISKFIINRLRLQKNSRRYQKPKKFNYNMIVIGAGSAGLVSAYIAAAVKAKVALIEKHKMGGDCLNTGCVPSKALIRSAKVAHYFSRASEFGISTQHMKINFSNVMERVQNVIQQIEPHDSAERYTELGVDCITGLAKIISPYEVEVNGKVLTTKAIIIATGAAPLVPPIPGLSDLKYLTSDTLWNLRTLPPRLLILGGGAIGCELAQSFSRLGSQVTIVEMSDRLLAREDIEASEIVMNSFKKEGVRVLTSHQAIRFDSHQKIVLCKNKENNTEAEIEFDEVIVALGRKPNIKGFGAEELKLEISDRGFLVADEYLRTTQFPNIYVCGDVTGPYQLTHAAAHQAWYVAVNALFSPLKTFAVDYKVIPWCTFTDPEVARVGLNELEAKEKGIDYQVTRYGIDDLDRAIADGEAHGFVKVLTKPGTDQILGVTIVGDHAGDIIAEYVMAMKHGLGMNKILSTIHIYPTLAEANKYAAGIWKKQNAPKALLKFVEKFHSWRRN
jgi:dihydrolipoamide dehydrogenase